MKPPRPLVPLIAALLAQVVGSAATAGDQSCVIEVPTALGESGSTKIADVTPLAEGAWVGDVYVLPFDYPETYDRQLPGGHENVAARQWVAQSFFEHNSDTYDFLAVITNFEFYAGWGQHGDPLHGLYWSIQNDVSGIGLPYFDTSNTFGARRLQGYIDVNDLDLVRDVHGNLDEQLLLTVLNHELGHRWLAHCSFEDGQGLVSNALLGVDGGHWSYLLDTNASYMYGARWRDNGDGSFTSVETKQRFSRLDLYLMGMLAPDEVGPITLLDNPLVPPDQYPELGVTIDATPATVTIDQVAAAEGPRNPAADDAPHELRIAVVYLVQPGSLVSNEDRDFLHSVRDAWRQTFFAQTEGRGLIGVGRNSSPAVSPDSIDLDAAMAWLLVARDGEGLWQDHPSTRGRDSAAAITALDAYGGQSDVVAGALDAIAGLATATTEVNAWRAVPLAGHQHVAAGNLLNELSSWVLAEGAWGSGLRYAGDTVTTARVASALAAGDRLAEAEAALSWITNRQNSDGGWSWRDGGPSATAPTLEAVSAAVFLDPQRWNHAGTQAAVTWLLGRRTQGGFGDPHPNIAATAQFLHASHGLPMAPEIATEAIDFLAARQRSDGSWGGSTYLTAMAITGLAPYVQPDLAVSGSELLVEPVDPFVDDQLTLRAAVHAVNADVPAGVAYRWEVVDASQQVVAALDGVLPPIGHTLFATVTDTWNLRYHVSAGTYTFRFTADSLGAIAEPDETNNSADLPVTFLNHPSWIDLELTPEEVWADPGIISSVPQTVIIEGIIRNNGWAEAGGAIIGVFETGSTALLGSTTTTVPMNGEASFQIPLQFVDALPHDLSIIADPDDLLGDADPSNNRVDLEIGVAPTYDPAVVPGRLEVSPSPPIHAGDLITISLDVANHGTQPISELQVGVLYATGNPPTVTPIRLLELASELVAGEVRTLAMEWQPPVADSAMTLMVEVDPSQLVSDIDRDNNTSELTVEVLPSPLPNLVIDDTQFVFDPEPAIQHQSVHISASVINQSDNSAGPFIVRLWLDDIDTGVSIGEIAATGLAPGDSLTIETDWVVDEMADRLVWIDVDADNQIPEFNEDDNQTFRVLDVSTLPDLVLTTGQISYAPRFPHDGEVVHFDVNVINTGDQQADDVAVEIVHEGGGVVGTTAIPVINGGGSASVAFDWFTDGLVGEQVIIITADPLDTLTELDEANNTIDVSLAVQDADLWVSDRYISPNGDEVKETTTVFVREPLATIDVADQRGTVIRVLDVDASTGQANWDGRKTDGAAARDGIYELVAGSLTTWVEVDLNGVSITDDIRQPLLIGTVPRTSSEPGGKFVSYSPSPVDGVVYLTEQLNHVSANRKVWRWNGESLDDVPDWPAGHWVIHQVSADERVFITGAGVYSLVRLPGPNVDPLTPPGPVDTPYLSPDGDWIIWVQARSFSSVHSFVLQSADDLNITHEFGPYLPGAFTNWTHQPTVHWSSNGDRAVVTMHRSSIVGQWEHAKAFIIDLDPTLHVAEVALERACGRIKVNDHNTEVTAAVDFERSQLICTQDATNTLFVMDLQTGSVVSSTRLPGASGLGEDWYRLSHDGRVVEVDETYIEDFKSTSELQPVSVFDWSRRTDAPWGTNDFQPWRWSALDRFAYSVTIPGGTHFAYTTPTANLTVALDPVVRFGGSGVDLFLTVTDRNLDFFQLEYAPVSDPEAFVPLGQPARGAILCGSWGTWIPPGQGTWRIRLTAADLAGNERSVSRWVTWNGVSDIAGVWTEDRHISPVSSPGVQDHLVWHYTVLRPAQLLFEIVDDTGALVRRIPVAAGQLGEATSTWDGLDDANRPVPDGAYRLTFRGAEWPVGVDNTPPSVTFEIADNELRPTPGEIVAAAGLNPPIDLVRSALFSATSWSVDDVYLDTTGFEARHIDHAEWTPIAAPAPFSSTNVPANQEAPVRAEWFAERIVRQVASDLAGNRSVAERFHREEDLAYAIAEPPCRSDLDPCLFPDRPDVDDLRDADGLMDDSVAVLWPSYSTFLVQSTIWGDWLDSLRFEFRVPADGGIPPGDWQPGTLTVADGWVWRTSRVLTEDPLAPTRELRARVVPIYWEHPGLPQRSYEVRFAAENRDGTEVAGEITLLVPTAPLAVEHLRTDAGGDHFRVHNIGTVQIDGITLERSHDGVVWRPVIDVGSLGSGLSALVSTGCSFLDAAIGGELTNWVRVVGTDPFGVGQLSLPAVFQRAGPPRASSSPNFALTAGSCAAGSPSAMGMMGYGVGSSGAVECTSWTCDLGWHSPGDLADLQLTIPGTDPNGTSIAGYELLIDGAAVAGAPDLIPGATERVTLDLRALGEGDHIVSERYLFAPGDEGLLSSCVQSANLKIDRSAELTIDAPVDGTVLCPDQGFAPIVYSADDPARETVLLIDGSTFGIGFDPMTFEPAILVSELEPGAHQLEVTVVDLAGNAACASVGFTTEGVAAVTGVEIDPPIFSPTNPLGRPTQTVIIFGSSASADWTAEIRDSFGVAIQGASGEISAGGTASLSWDGRDFEGELVTDGDFGLWIRLESDCGAIYESPAPHPEITIDTSSPTVVVANPNPGAWIQTAIEIQALVADTHFERWEARISPLPAAPGSWQVIGSGERPSSDPNNLLLRWASGHLDPGDYAIVLEATDRPGNQSLTDEIPIVVHDLELIEWFEAAPIYFSPNGDGAADTTEFRFELLQDATITLLNEGWVTLLENEPLSAGVVYTVTWDGLGGDLQPVPDGVNGFTLQAWRSDLGIWESETATVIIDRASPTVVITSPQHGAILAPPLTVAGHTTDPHADTYTITLRYPDGSTEDLDSGLGDWSAGEPFILDELTDGQYRLSVTASDLAENVTTVEHDFEIDQTAPSVVILSPGAGATVDPLASTLVLRGAIASAHPESYAWWIADGAAPASGDFVLIHQALLATGGEVEHQWAGPPPNDGLHTLLLTATDLLGRTGEARHIITIDSRDPDVEIWEPAAGSVITGPVSITGLVDDANLTHWIVEEIPASGPVRSLGWGIATAQGDLATWDPLPDDGPFTIRLTARDTAGHVSEVAANVEVSVQPPGPPTDLTANPVNVRDVDLSWQQGAGPQPVGYHIERNGDRITTVPLTGTTYLDPQLLDGVYRYRAVAVGPLGRESEPSEPATVVINAIPPAVALIAPGDGARISGEIEVRGTAFSVDDFALWEVAARIAGAPDWIVLDSGTAPVAGGLITNWNTYLAPWSDGLHELRLAAEDTFANRAETAISLTVDNTAPDPGPANLQAALTALDPDALDNDVQLSWIQTPTPSDLAGFYLYRNGLLANAGGPVVGDPSPYLLHDTAYDDRDVPDGTYIYTVAAADIAGNISTLSNPAGPVTIDIRRPHAVIISPGHGTEFEGSVEVSAECDDEDVVLLELQYRLASAPDWSAMAPSFTDPPYVTVFAPPETGLYFLRVVASDAVGPDPAPHIIEVNSVDLPPRAPLQLTAQVTGDQCTLVWITPPDLGDDLAGFNVFRDGLQINTELVPPDTLAYVDSGLLDGSYEYTVAAVDQASQQGEMSGPASAEVSTPHWDWAAPVIDGDHTPIAGGGAHAVGSVELFRRTPVGGTLSVATLIADGDGSFSLDDAELSPGVNVFTAVSTDGLGNTSRMTLPSVVVSHPRPETPAQLEAVTAGSDVTLSWTAAANSGSTGFAVRRSGSVVNETTAPHPYDIATHTLFATGGDPGSWALVVDGDPATGWTPTRVPTMGTPESWSWSWTDPVELFEIGIGWSPAMPPQTFDVDVLVDGEWLWLASAAWSGDPSFTLPAGIVGTGIRIRLPMSGTCGNSSCLPELTEVAATSVVRTTETNYLDSGLPDGAYAYDVRRWNRWGQSSDFARTTVAVGLDQPVPPIGLTATALDCAGIRLDWQPGGAQPGTLVGYTVHRSESATGEYESIAEVGPAPPSFVDVDAPVGGERYWVATARVDMGGVIVDSAASESAMGTATCTNPPPPVITAPTTAGLPLQIAPWQVPITIAGSAVPGSTITLLHDGAPVASTISASAFEFHGVDVHAGTNTFVARQEVHGHIGDSLPIEIEIDPAAIPDLTAVSLSSSPQAAAVGSSVLIEGVVELLGSAGVSEVFDAVIEVDDPNGQRTEIYRTTLSLGAGDIANLRTVWAAAAPAGWYDWRLVVDPDDSVLETDESNNTSTSRTRVLAWGGLELAVSIDRPLYLVGQQLLGELVFASADPPADYVLEARLEDAGGGLVAILDTRPLTAFGADWIAVPFGTFLDGIYPGLYRIHGIASIDGVTVAEALAPFQLEPLQYLEATVTTDRSAYVQGEVVTVAGRIVNLGPSLIENLQATLSVIDEGSGLIVAQSTVSEISLGAGDWTEVGWSWPTLAAPAGAYRAEFTVADATGFTLAEAPPFPFIVTPGDAQLAASIELSNTPVEPGDPVTASVSVTNSGLIDLPDLMLTLKVIDPVAVAVIEEHTHPMSLAAGATGTFDQALTTDGLELQRYVILVSAAGDDGRAPFEIDLASAVLEVSDLSPPTISLIKPPPGGVACDLLVVEAEVVDTLSRVDHVTSYLDDEPNPISLHLADPAQNPHVYTASRPLPVGPDQAHQISIIADDIAGNTSDAVTGAFVADTGAPILEVVGPADGSCVPGGVSFTFTATDPNLVSIDAVINGQSYLSGTPITVEGDHLLEVAATDVCGHTGAENRHFTLDATAPVILVDGVIDGGEVPTGTILSWSATDLHLESALANLDGVAIGSPVSLDEPGIHTLTVTAVDCAGNATEFTATFTVIEAILSLGGTTVATPEVLEPGEDVLASATITNNGSTVTAVQLTLDVVHVASSTVVATYTDITDLTTGQTHAMATTFGTTGWDLGYYSLRLTARGVFAGSPFDLSLASSSMTLADMTEPQLTVVSPATGLVCDPVVVVAEAADALTGIAAVVAWIDVDPAAVPLTHVSGSTWTANLVLDEGEHHLEVVATDGAGNPTPPWTIDIDLDTVPPVLTVTAPDDGACLAEGVTIEFAADDAHLSKLTATLNGTAISSGHTVSDDGSYQLSISAEDECGRQTGDERSFVIDTIDPTIDVTGLVDGETYAVGSAGSWNADDDNLVSAEALLDGVAVDPSFTVQTVGNHLLETDAEDCAGNRTELDLSFVTVLAEDGLSGSLTIDPIQLEPPELLTTAATVTNEIDTSYPNLTMRLELVDPATGAVVDSAEMTAGLAVATSLNFDHVFTTMSLGLGEYTVRFSASGSVYGAVFDTELATADFEVVDRTPPSVTLLSPTAGLACESIEVRAEAHDNLSGVDAVRVHVDGDPVGTPLTTAGNDLWIADLTLIDGLHHLSLVALDGVGNPSDPVTEDIDLDLSEPELTVDAPQDNECRATPTTIVFSADDAHLEALRARLNGESIPTGYVVSTDGDYHLRVSATDACGNRALHDISFVVDTIDPTITVTGVADGGEYSEPVEITWTIQDAHLVESGAWLDGEPVEPGVAVDSLGEHRLVIDAIDCAGNERRTETNFTLIEEGPSAIQSISPSTSTAGVVLFVDQSPTGGRDLELWLADRVDRVARVQDGCALAEGLRDIRHDVVVLYSPVGANPLSADLCAEKSEIEDLAWELSASAYRRGGILVLGDGFVGDECLGCRLAATGTRIRTDVLAALDVEGLTTILDPPPDLTIFDLQPLELEAAFPVLAGGTAGVPDCDGLRAATLSIETNVTGPWLVAVDAATAHEALDRETGILDDGERIDQTSHPWVDLVARREGSRLYIDASANHGGALPSWLALSVSIAESNPGAPPVAETSAWLPTNCSLTPGDVFELMQVETVEAISHGEDQIIAASARRYGRGEALVLPWDVLDPANIGALPLVAQALDFSSPTEPWPAVTGLPLPVTFGARNTGATSHAVRIAVEVPLDQMLEVWGEPTSVDPLIWEFRAEPGATAKRTVWLRPTIHIETIELPYSIRVEDGDDWVVIEEGAVSIDVLSANRSRALRELDTAIGACAVDVHDPALRATLRNLMAAVDRIGAAGDDHAASITAIRDLTGAFAAAEGEPLPCLAEIRGRLADLMRLWQAQWVATGGLR